MRSTEPGLRRDAARNRELILQAARETFAELGVDAPLEEIARRAGVGIATLYRRFPTREALIEAIFESKAHEYVRAAEAGLEADDPWEGFRSYVERICAMQAEDRGFNDVLRMTFRTATGLEACRDRAYAAAKELIDRAQAQGGLRADFVPGDIVWILMANGTFLEATGELAPDAWRRYVALILDAVRAERATDPLPPPASDGELRQAMLRMGRP